VERGGGLCITTQGKKELIEGNLASWRTFRKNVLEGLGARNKNLNEKESNFGREYLQRGTGKDYVGLLERD